MTNKAPVEAVGGRRSDGGPWPDEINEITQDDRLKRTVSVNGESEIREVVVTDVVQIGSPDAYRVVYQHSGGDT